MEEIFFFWEGGGEGREGDTYCIFLKKLIIEVWRDFET